MSKELTASNEKQINPLSLIQVAIEKNLDPASLDKLYDLQERHEINQAKKAFNHAMSEFAKNAPKLVKDKNVNFNKTQYKYVTLASIVNEVQKVMSGLGLSHRWKTTQENGFISVECIVTHELGYSESSSFTAPPDTSGAKNNIQAIGSTISYGQRYTLLSILGLSAFEDDDARDAVNVEYITKEQETELNDLIKEKKVNLTSFKKYFQIETLCKLRSTEYVRAINMIEAKNDNT